MATVQEQMVLQISADLTNVKRAIVGFGGVLKQMDSQVTTIFNHLGVEADNAANKMVSSAKRARTGMAREHRAAANEAIAEQQRVSAYAQANARNLTFQINDVLSALATGQGIRGVAQQFGQISQAFAGTPIRQTLLGLLSTGNLLTIALTAAGAAAAYFFTESSKGAAELDKGLNDIINKFGDLAPAAKNALQEFTYNRSLAQNIKDIETEIENLKKESLEAVSGAQIGGIDISSLELTSDEQYKVLGLWWDIRDAIEHNQPALKETAELLQFLGTVQSSNTDETKTFATEVAKLVPKFKLWWQMAQNLRVVQQQVADSNYKSVEAMKAFDKAMEELNNVGNPALTETDKIARSLADALANAAGNAGKLIDAFAAAADASQRVGTEGLRDMGSALVGNLDDYSRAVADFETGGRNIKNIAGISTAQGPWQLLNQAFVDAWRRIDPQLRSASDAFILKQRGNIEAEQRAFDEFTAENRRYLAAHGHTISEANLFLSHLFGAGGFEKIMRQPAGARAEDFLTPAELAGQPWARGKTAGEIQDWAGAEVRRRAAKTRGQDARDAVEADKEDLDIQGKITDAYDEQAAKEAERLKFAELRRDLEKRAAEEHRAVTEEELANARETAKLAGEAAGREAGAKKAETFEGRLKGLQDENELLRQQAEQLGYTSEALAALLSEQERKAALDEAENETLKIKQDLKRNDITLTDAQTEALRTQQQTIALSKAGLDKLKDSNKENAKSMEEFNKQIANIAKGAVSGFINDLRNGVSAGDAFRNMLDRVIDGLIDMTLNAIFAGDAVKGIGGAAGGGGGGLGGILGAIFGIGAEKGAIAGESGEPILIPAKRLKHARHFQSGGWAGGIPAVLHPGELVIPRAVMMAAGRGGGAMQDNSSVSMGDVNIDMSRSGYVAADNDSAKQFGIQVQKIVQVELVRESRPGGLLRKVPA